MNWVQRIILIIAGLLLLLFAFGAATNYNSDSWPATFMFLAAIFCFWLAASS